MCQHPIGAPCCGSLGLMLAHGVAMPTLVKEEQERFTGAPPGQKWGLLMTPGPA